MKLLFRVWGVGYLTGGKDELVTALVRLITKDVRLFHVELLRHSQESQEVIVYCHPCNCLKGVFCFVKIAKPSPSCCRAMLKNMQRMLSIAHQ